MNSPIEMTGAHPATAFTELPKPRFDPYTGEPIGEPHERTANESFIDSFSSIGAHERIEQQFQEVPEEAKPPVNPYAPTGWKRRHRQEFDIYVPSGQLCRVMCLEREDLFRMNLMQYLDTFTPTLMDNSDISEAEKDRRVKESLKTNPNALGDMFMAIDQVVMAATIRPKITNDTNLVDYGTEKDWRNPRFIATAHIDDINMDDRMGIFAAAFGKSMDDLKSVFDQTPGMGGLADEPGVQQATE